MLSFWAPGADGNSMKLSVDMQCIMIDVSENISEHTYVSNDIVPERTIRCKLSKSLFSAILLL